MMDIQQVQSCSIVDALFTELSEGFDKIPRISQEWSVELTGTWDTSFDLFLNSLSVDQLRTHIERLFNPVAGI